MKAVSAAPACPSKQSGPESTQYYQLSIYLSEKEKFVIVYWILKKSLIQYKSRKKIYFINKYREKL